MYLMIFGHDTGSVSCVFWTGSIKVWIYVVWIRKYLFHSNLLYPPLLSSGVAGLWVSFTLSSWTGEEVRWSILAGVLALLGRAFGVEGLPRVDGGLGEAAGLGDVGLPLLVVGEDGRCLDKGLGLEGQSFSVYQRAFNTRCILLDAGWNVEKWPISSISLTSTYGSRR